MLKETAFKHFETGYKVAKLLNLSRQAVYQWGDVVPLDSARKLEAISNGKIKVKPKLYSNGAEK